MQRRRAIELLTTALAVGATLGWRSETGRAAGSRRRIDVHHHFLPPEYVAAVGAAAIGAPAPTGRMPPWSVAQALALMDAANIATALLSISAPGFALDDTARQIKLVRSCNEFAAGTAHDHAGRFGSFAALPLPDIASSLLEIRHSLDVLKADGICLHTHYAGRYLGDPWFRPVLQELHARKAVVFVHPTTCRCGALPLPDLPESLIEFPHDTTRAITSLLYAGVFTDLPGIQFIFSHAGGTFPYIAQRVASLADVAPQRLVGATGASLLAALRRQYYDVALSANPLTLQALLRFTEPQQVLFGTDYPFAPPAAVAGTVAGLEASVQGDALHAIEYGNAARLFTQFAV